ncbi:MAG: RNA polymerase sigma factor SigA [Cellulomonadaceae bacterium TMED98]|nr:MAG: RNA polymerase sigma factor SigA [Cellulomonadaceae bacterium TMED98]
MRAIQKYDIEKGFKFSTYAFNWIEQAISRAISSDSNLIRVPVHAFGKVRAFHRWLAEDAETGLKEPSKARQLDRLARDFSSEPEAIWASVTPVESLDSYPYLALSHEEGCSYSELIDFHEELPECELEEEHFRRQLRATLDVHLDEKSADVLRMRFGIDCKVHTLDQVGEEFGFTRERARQIQKKAMIKVREEAEWLLDHL